MNYKRILFLTVIVSLSISALLGIITFLIGNFGSTELRIIGTTFFVGIYSLSGLASFTLYEKKKYQILATANITFAIASFLMTELAVWELLNIDDVYKSVFGAGIIAYAMAHISLVMLLNPKSQAVRTIQLVTVTAIVIVAGILNLMIFESISSYDNEGILRILGVCAILSATGTILGPIINKAISPSEKQETTGLNELGIATHAETGEKFTVYKEKNSNTGEMELKIKPLT